MPILKLALDRSMRTVDADGRLHIEKSNISKACVNPYMGKEIPGYKELGLDAEKIYNLLRHPDELEKGAASFARLPILSEHVPVTVDTPQPDLVIGAIGSNVSFEAPYLVADLCFWDAASIAGIDSGKVKELSCAYRYVPLMQPGNFEGEDYDGIMTEILGNHLCLVEAGRAGSDVYAADSNPFSFKEKTMKMNKLGKAIFAALSIASPTLAADAALPALLGGNITKKTFKKAEFKEKLMGMDAALDSTKLDAVLDAIMDTEADPNPKAPQAPMNPGTAPAKDASPMDKVREMLAGKVDDATMDAVCGMMGAPAADAENPEDNDDEEEPTENDQPVAAKDVKAAMDSAIKNVRREMREANEARADVRTVVGDVVAMDSAAEIYGFALDHLEIDREGVTGVPSLKALFKLATAKAAVQVPTHIAQDAASLEKRFPGAARFRNA